MARLLVCNTCKTVDKLPDFQPTNDPEIIKHDRALIDAIDRHKNKYLNKVSPNDHFANIYTIADDELALIDEKRLEQAVHDGRMESFLREERENYKEDALGCYNLHNRPTIGIGYGLGCPDYRSKSKAIGRTTGIPEDEWSYICDFCPYHSYVEHAARKHAARKKSVRYGG